MSISKKIFLYAPLALIWACGNSTTEVAGSTTETENAALQDEGVVTIKVFDGKKPAANVSYRVLPSWYVTDTTGVIDENDYSYTGTTDSTGLALIENHKDGSYTIQFEKGESSISYQYTLNKLSQEFSVDKATLQKKGSVKGWLSLPEKAKHAWVHVPGLGRVQKTDSLGQFVIEDLPVGDVSIKSWNESTQECIAQTEVSVVSGETTDIGHVEAPDEVITKKSMRINPRNLVSSWMKPKSAPYVVVLRLDSTNFNFDEAAEDGSDIHLLSSDGEELPIEIDSWDASIHSAAINIRLNDLKDTSDIWTLEWGDIYAEPQKQSNVWKGLSDSLLYELNSVEIFNFDSGSVNNDLPSPLKREAVYIQIHEVVDSTKDSINTQTLSTSNALQKDTEGRSGTVLHVEYTANHPDLMLIGTHLSSIPCNFSRMDSLVVWIRSDGDYEIILEALKTDKNYKASYKGKGKSSWERLSLKPEDFDYTIKEYHGWEITRNKITNFTIFGYNGSELWLDNVRIYGINRDDIKQ
ncbi:MAG: hypothetical protein MJY99_02870 [Fibrobacter sp.]|nr:hypothetical protein [Fibrobacter sp.]